MAEQDTPPDDIPQPIGKASAAKAPAKKSEMGDTLRFLVKLAIIVWLFRSFVFAPFSIPSESMLPRLLIGDYLFVSKWNYGYSRWSLPFGFRGVCSAACRRVATPSCSAGRPPTIMM